MSTFTADEHGILAEIQGPFASETLPNSENSDVLTVRYLSDEHWLDIAIAPTIPQSLSNEDYEIAGDPKTGVFEVTVCVELREAGDDDGNTSDYRYEDILDGPVSYDEAVKAARFYIENIKPDEELSRFEN